MGSEGSSGGGNGGSYLNSEGRSWNVTNVGPQGSGRFAGAQSNTGNLSRGSGLSGAQSRSMGGNGGRTGGGGGGGRAGGRK